MHGMINGQCFIQRVGCPGISHSLISSFPSPALLTSAIYLYYFPTPKASCPLPFHLRNHDSVWNTVCPLPFPPRRLVVAISTCVFHINPYKCRNELSWRYQSLLQSLERKQTEVEQLSQEFESKIRAKEVKCFLIISLIGCLVAVHVHVCTCSCSVQHNTSKGGVRTVKVGRFRCL